MSAEKILIDAEAVLRIFKDENAEILGLFVKQALKANETVMDEHTMVVWLDGFYASRDYFQED